VVIPLHAATLHWMKKCNLQFTLFRNLETTERRESFMFFRIRFYPESLVASSFAKFYLSRSLRVVTLPKRTARRHLMALEGNASQNLCFVLVLALTM